MLGAEIGMRLPECHVAFDRFLCGRARPHARTHLEAGEIPGPEFPGNVHDSVLDVAQLAPASIDLQAR
jgi:hypothetical protein